MAAHQDVPELLEELQPLAEDAAPVQRMGRRSKVAVAVGVSLAVAAAVTLLPGSAAPAIKEAKVGAVQGKFKKWIAAQKEAAPLTIEGDMGTFISEDSLPEETKNRGLGASAGQAASALFDHVATTATLSKELNDKELRAYKYRFVTAMVGMTNTNKGEEDYVARAKKHIDGSKPVMTDSIARATNKRQRSFKVEMQDWMIEESKDSFEARLIRVPWVAPADSTKVHKGALPEDGYKGGNLPTNFESGKFWPRCKGVIENPHNQGRCGSCWVFGATGALDSRMCIASDGAFSGPNAALSRGVGASCAAKWDGCQGGWPHLVYDYIAEKGGIPSTNCVPYFGGTDYASHWTDAMGAPPCPTSCDSRFPRSMAADLFNPVGVAQYKLVDTPNDKGIQDLREAIFNEGPVSYALYANHAFMGYSGGVFNMDCGHQANHAVQAIGFGKAGGQDYIQSLNSWGTRWGLTGKFNVAPCVVWHYVIPGSFETSSFPLPIPSWKQ